MLARRQDGHGDKTPAFACLHCRESDDQAWQRTGIGLANTGLPCVSEGFCGYAAHIKGLSCTPDIREVKVPIPQLIVERLRRGVDVVVAATGRVIDHMNAVH